MLIAGHAAGAFSPVCGECRICWAPELILENDKYFLCLRLKENLFPIFYLFLIKYADTMAVQTLKKVFRFYVDGFRSMTVGKTLWAIILVKLFIMFAVLKLFFFPDFLAGQSPEERSRSVMKELTPEK